MKNVTTLGKVAERVDELSQNCTDRMIPVGDISFNHLESVNIAGEHHPMRPIAQQSIAWRLGIPIQYLRKCPEVMQAYNMNYWIKYEKNEDLFFRFQGDQVRAIFTPKYKPVDNFEVLERLDSLGYGPDTGVQCQIDAEFMLISVLDGNRSFSVNGEKMTPGISISNSEVGLASLSLAAFILRLVCTNGLISKTEISASYRHVSRKILDEFPQVLDRISNEVGNQRDKLRISMQSPVPNPAMTIESFNRQFQLGKEEREAVEWGATLEPGNTMFHIVNAYTRAAQYKGLTAESSYKLQKTGGMILGMLN